MLKHNKKVAAGNNKKKVRYGPVRYVNLKLDEPIFTNTYHISELCQNCGAVRSGPNIDDGCKNCSVPKPIGLVFLNKKEFLSRNIKRSKENLDQVKENIDDNQKLISNIESCKNNGSDIKRIHAEVKSNSDQLVQNIVVAKHKLHSNDEISVLSFEEKIKLLEKSFHPREFKPQDKQNQELILSALNQSQQSLEQPKETENNDKKRTNDSVKKENKIPKTIRNLYKNDEKKVRFEKNLSYFDKKYIADFENKLKFFEDKNSPVFTSTRSLESFEPKPLFVDTYQTVENIKNKEFPTYGSNISLDHSHFHVDNLNDIPKLLGSISKTNNRSSNTEIFQSPESLNKTSKIIPRIKKNDKENSAEIAVPKVKPRKNWIKNNIQIIKKDIEKQVLEEKFCNQKIGQTIELTENYCKACGGSIKSECIEAEGSLWHLEHFCCSECSCFLADKQYLVFESNFFCLNCHQKKFPKVCQTCKLGIDTIDTRFTYEKLDWHSNPNCFKCYRCCKNLCDVPFLIKKNRLFCSMNCKKIFFDN